MHIAFEEASSQEGYLMKRSVESVGFRVIVVTFWAIFKLIMGVDSAVHALVRIKWSISAAACTKFEKEVHRFTNRGRTGAAR